MTDKEKLLTRLKEWAAAGFKLRRDATHLYMHDEPAFTDMKKIEGVNISYWSQLFPAWVEQISFNSAPPKYYLPLSLLSDEELKEFIEDSTGENNVN